MNNIIKAFITTAVMTGVSFTQAAVINFEADGSGTPYSAGNTYHKHKDGAHEFTFETDAFTIKQGETSDKPAKLMIFDSANPTGGDGDLASPGYGLNNTDTDFQNILIISENNDGTNPDDHRYGGNIYISFMEDILIESIGLLDIENDKTKVSLFDEYYNRITYKKTQDVRDNGFQELVFNTSGVYFMEIELKGSGAITHVNYQYSEDPVIEVPTGDANALLIALGLMGLVMSRRNVKKYH